MHLLQKLLALCALTLLFSVLAQAATITCAGVLGNSGEQGEALVRSNTNGASGIGVVCDRFGTLWDRGGMGTLNRYALDGRLIAQYKMPNGNNRDADAITLAGDTIIICINGQLYQLPITAPSGSEAKAMDVKADRISSNAVKNTIALGRGGELGLLDVTTGKVQIVGQYKGGLMGIEMDANGALYPITDWVIHKVVNGQEVTEGWPKGMPGERPQLVDGFWYGHTWHGTVKRYTAEMDPAPGVVLGGASGSFIGHLDENAELTNGRGMAKVRDGLYAISGMGGVLHLLSWQEDKQQFTIIRRIGSIPNCPTLGLDSLGNVFFQAGAWKWNDTPDAPQLLGVNGVEEMGQAVMLDNDCIVLPGYLWGKPIIYCGPLTSEVSGWRIEGQCAMPRGLVGSAVYKAQNELVLLTITKNGQGQSFFINANGGYRGERSPVTLQVATPVQAWTSLGMKNADTLLGAADGYIVEFARNGNDWKETRRWNTWGTGERFGGRIYLSTNAGRLWVSDRERHRIVVFDLASGNQLALFGKSDSKGTDLASLAYPETLTACKDRAIVFDSGNQRLMKLQLR